MNIGIYQSAGAMQGLEQWQDQVARNLSASSVPGYQRQETVFESVLAGEAPGAEKARPVQGPAQMVQTTSRTVFEPGQVRHTGGEFDFTVRPGAFFKAELPDGRAFFTRDGHFQLDGDGTLVNNRGLPVQVNGAPLMVNGANGPVTANAAGELMQNNAVIGQLDISTFDFPEELAPALGGFIESTPGMAGEKPAEDPRVAQGTIESSNVSPIEEMTRLITLSRAYETHQKLIHHQDEAMQKALRYLNPSASS